MCIFSLACFGLSYLGSGGGYQLVCVSGRLFGVLYITSLPVQYITAEYHCCILPKQFPSVYVVCSLN